MYFRARQYYDIARNISLNGFGESDPVSITTAYLLLSDYAPSEKEYFHYSWKMAESVCLFIRIIIIIIISNK